MSKDNFYLVEYEARFDLIEDGGNQLAEVSKLSKERDVALVCQCRDFDRCHCDLLLLWAKHAIDAPVTGLIFDYPVFRKRLECADMSK